MSSDGYLPFGVSGYDIEAAYGIDETEAEIEEGEGNEFEQALSPEMKRTFEIMDEILGYKED